MNEMHLNIAYLDRNTECFVMIYVFTNFTHVATFKVICSLRKGSLKYLQYCMERSLIPCIWRVQDQKLKKK